MSSTAPVRRASRQARVRGAAFRPDIQGLRSVAVLLVVANHLFQWPTGGYIGVDVFFVISGYLIAGNLVREQTSSGWISISAFYARRLRRIMPVALVVALVTVAVGYAIWFPLRANQTLLDGLASTFWVANWHFAGIGTDYLAATGPLSPFQHYWSLSVEEQFYVFMPWVIIALAALAAKLRRRRETILLLGLCVIMAASFLWSFLMARVSPSIAYFDTIGRSWEFIAGALLAVLAVSLAGIPAIAGRIMQMAGLVLIGVGAVMLNTGSAFPAPGAVVPVAGAVLVIIGGGSAEGQLRLLTNRLAQYIGKVSYSLYLWHFPTIVYAKTVFPDESLLVTVGALAIALLLSHLSYHYVEAPARESRRLSSWEVKPARIRRPWRRKQVFAGIAIGLMVTLLACSQLKGPAQLRSAEAFYPSPNAAMDTCRNPVDASAPQLCTYGDSTASQSVLVVGDSVAASWIPSVAAAWPQKKTLGLGFASCSPFAVDTLPRVVKSTFVSDCRTDKDRMFDTASRIRPEMVVLSSDLGGYERQASGAVGEEAATAWAEGVHKTAEQYAALGTRVVILSSPPTSGDVRSCTNRFSGYSHCDADITATWMAKTAAESKAARDVGVQFVDVRDWFCVANTCPALVDGTVARSDSTHITEAMAMKVGHFLAAAVSSQSAAT